MKKLKFIIALMLTANLMFAQKIIEKNIDYSNQPINIEVKFANNIIVKTWDKSSVYFKAEIHTEGDKHQDSYKLDINKSSSGIYIASEAEPVFKAFREEWNKNNPTKKSRFYNTGDIYEFNYTIYIPKNAQFKISSINGDLTSEVIEGDFTADLINGNIDIAKYSGNLDLSTINGEIDLKMVNVNLVAETIHGDIYADEKLKFTSKNRHVGQKIYGTIDKATNRLRLNTINGNMYLRL
jgi:hypothetical protein